MPPWKKCGSVGISRNTSPAGLLLQMIGKRRLLKTICASVEGSKPPWPPRTRAQVSIFAGVYTNVKEHKLIEYDLEDGRHVKVEFAKLPEGVKVTEIFEPENTYPENVQRSGWQAILNNFKKYVEAELMT